MSLTELPPGQEKVAGPRWWTRVSYVGLVILGVAAAVALIVGLVAGRSNAEALAALNEPAAVAPLGDSPDDLVAQCRPPVARAADEPWIAGDGSAEAIWQEHADEIAKPYLLGPNGWLFWSDTVEQYASQAVGRSFLTTGQAQNWTNYFASIRDGLAAEGVEFYVIVTPSTSSVYPEELPEWMQGITGSTSMDQFMAASGDLPVIDLRQTLIDAKDDTEFHSFSWSNSHWTDFGGYIGWTQVAPCVNEMFPDQPPLQVPTLAGVEIIGDFNEWAPYGAASQGADWAVPIFNESMGEVTRTDKDGTTEILPGSSATDASLLPVTTEVDAPWTGKSAVIVRDSMGGALSAYWQQSYSPTWQSWFEYATFDDFPKFRELAAQHKPDVVIMQFAERHLIQVPPAQSGF